MPRATTTSDVFNAVAEPRRRQILELLAAAEHPVGTIGSRLRLSQPSVSKHLSVLRRVGLVRARRHGRQLFYRTEAQALRPVHDWTKTFEHYWSHQLLQIKQRAEAMPAPAATPEPPDSHKEK